MSHRKIVPTIPSASVFLNWSEETDKTRKNVFNDKIMANLKREFISPQAPQQSSETSSPRTESSNSNRQSKMLSSRAQEPPQPPVFECI